MRGEGFKDLVNASLCYKTHFCRCVTPILTDFVFIKFISFLFYISILCYTETEVKYLAI